ncbi:GNAT family N-acetyltransferase [Microlunatus panaciterrae]|uniref:Acetyltransferase n=1 Tax=Microlunatus panaciterrae TaxID=400768 RepID=A0ABS2RH03_9ACTN|nr:GNAT family N-acetyltransferase [Microlunatus panaciterrae]MBM7797958.1 putative acetyltransferase [Microlunatus panaciterrae]
MSLPIRILTETDAETSRRLSHEAFGAPRTPPTEPATLTTVGQTQFGAYDGEVLAARTIDREFDSHFGGALVPTSGIAGVTVVAEYRGRGLLTPLFDEMLEHARRRGAVISTLYPSAPRIYRRFGYEVVGDFFTVRVPTAVLSTVRAPGSITLRRATAEDHDSIKQVYDRWASAQNGPLSRRGVSFQQPAAEFLAQYTGVTVAVDGSGTIIGYACWNRGHGTSMDETLSVLDLLADSADGYQALLNMFGTFSSVTGHTSIDTSGDDPARMFLPSLHWDVTHASPYMLKVLDLPGAFAARGYPSFIRADLGFRLEGDFLAGNDGGYRLHVDAGSGECVARDDQQGPVFTARGLALVYAGVQSCANLRTAGQLRGGTPETDELWDTVFGGRQLHIRNYF